MTTIIKFKDGHWETLEHCAPSVDMDARTVNGVLDDFNSTTYGDDIPLDLVASVEFVP